MALALADKAPASVKVTADGKPVDSRFALKDGKLVITLAADVVINAGQKLEVVARLG